MNNIRPFEDDLADGIPKTAARLLVDSMSGNLAYIFNGFAYAIFPSQCIIDRVLCDIKHLLVNLILHNGRDDDCQLFHSTMLFC